MTHWDQAPRPNTVPSEATGAGRAGPLPGTLAREAGGSKGRALSAAAFLFHQPTLPAAKHRAELGLRKRAQGWYMGSMRRRKRPKDGQ